jgi:hypothetical protein
MMNYQEIQQKCTAFADLSVDVLDLFLIDYHLKRTIEYSKLPGQLKKYDKQLKQLPGNALDLIIAEYAAYEIFKASGAIHKYLKNSDIVGLPKAEYQYLSDMAKHPWRFSFSMIVGTPAPGFFKMIDVFTDEEYLLYSPGIHDDIQEEKRIPSLCFNLISFNGDCWQTFGIVKCFNAFTVDDVFFLAQQLNPKIELEEEVMLEVDKQCIPFILMILGSKFPKTSARGFDMLYVGATEYMEDIDDEFLAEDFDIQRKSNIIKFTFEELSLFPHNAVAYYDKKRSELSRFAMTLEGYDQMSEALIDSGIMVDPGFDFCITPAMLTTAGSILGRKPVITSPYENLFQATPSQEEIEENQKLNAFLEELKPYINRGEKPDLNALAFTYDIDLEFVEEIWEKLSNL